MKIKAGVEEKVKEYKVGDVIVWREESYTIIKNPANELYSLLMSDCDCFANGMFTTIEKLMEDFIAFTKNGIKHYGIKHYPKSEYELRIVKKEENK